MTCIVAVEYPGGCVLGTDSFTGGSSWRDRTDRPKWIVRNRVILACAGSVSVIQTAYAAFSPRPAHRAENDVDYIHKTIVSPVRTAIRKHHAETDEFGAVIVMRSRAYWLDHSFALERSAYGYCAIGSGYAVASGALCATQKHDPERRCRAALRAAAMHCNSVVGPFWLVNSSSSGRIEVCGDYSRRS